MNKSKTICPQGTNPCQSRGNKPIPNPKTAIEQFMVEYTPIPHPARDQKILNLELPEDPNIATRLRYNAHKMRRGDKVKTGDIICATVSLK